MKIPMICTKCAHDKFYRDEYNTTRCLRCGASYKHASAKKLYPALLHLITKHAETEEGLSFQRKEDNLFLCYKNITLGTLLAWNTMEYTETDSCFKADIFGICDENSQFAEYKKRFSSPSGQYLRQLLLYTAKEASDMLSDHIIAEKKDTASMQNLIQYMEKHPSSHYHKDRNYSAMRMSAKKIILQAPARNKFTTKAPDILAQLTLHPDSTYDTKDILLIANNDNGFCMLSYHKAVLHSTLYHINQQRTFTGTEKTT